jgi:hypothetical protein
MRVRRIDQNPATWKHLWTYQSEQYRKLCFGAFRPTFGQRKNKKPRKAESS